MGSNTYAAPKEFGEMKFEEWLPFMAANDPIVYNMLKKHGCTGQPYDCAPLDIPIEALRDLCVALFRDRDRLLKRCEEMTLKAVPPAIPVSDLKLSMMREWTNTFGKALCPPGPDTYGEGMRDAKAQVAAILDKVFP
jgi:hypothetical protein